MTGNGGARIHDFIVQRPTPGKSVGRILALAFPFDVEVEGPLPRTDYAATCKCQSVYRITEESCQDLKRRDLLPQRFRGAIVRPCVCQCMGALVR